MYSVLRRGFSRLWEVAKISSAQPSKGTSLTGVRLVCERVPLLSFSLSSGAAEEGDAGLGGEGRKKMKQVNHAKR